MSRDPAAHLTPDEIESWHAGPPPAQLAAHLDACTSCREQVRLERELDALLASLQLPAPREGFADRVMARVRLADPYYVHAFGRLRHRVASSRRAMVTAVAASVFLVASLSSSIVWTLSHRSTLAAAGTWARGEAFQLVWTAVHGAVAAFLAQPWSGAVRSWLGSGGHVAVAAGGALAVYLAGLIAFRRLLALPSARVADGHA